MNPERQLARYLPAFFAALAAAAATSIGLTALIFVIGSVNSAGIGVLFGFITFIVAVPITIAHALLLGLPAYLLLRRHVRLSYASAAIAGFMIGAVPIGLHVYSPLGVPYFPDPAIETELLRRTCTGFAFGLVGAFGGLAFRRSLRVFESDEARL